MNLCKEHIFRLFWIGLLVITGIFLSNEGITRSADFVHTTDMQPNTGVPVESALSDSGQEPSTVFSEQDEPEDSDPGMNTHVFTEQAYSHSFLPAKEFSATGNFYTRMSRPVVKEFCALLQNLPLFVYKLNPPPLISGIAINAP